MLRSFSKVEYFFCAILFIINLLSLVPIPNKIGIETTVAKPLDLLDQGQSFYKTGDSSNSSSGLLSSLSSATSAFLNNNTINNNTSSKPISQEDYDRVKNCNADTSKRPSSIEYLTYFSCGHVKTDALSDGNQQVT